MEVCVSLLSFKYFTLNSSSISYYLGSCIRSSEKFLSFYKEMVDAQHFPFHIILSNYV